MNGPTLATLALGVLLGAWFGWVGGERQVCVSTCRGPGFVGIDDICVCAQDVRR